MEEPFVLTADGCSIFIISEGERHEKENFRARVCNPARAGGNPNRTDELGRVCTPDPGDHSAPHSGRSGGGRLYSAGGASAGLPAKRTDCAGAEADAESGVQPVLHPSALGGDNNTGCGGPPGGKAGKREHGHLFSRGREGLSSGLDPRGRGDERRRDRRSKHPALGGSQRPAGSLLSPGE